jgi:hypothetical protein
MKARPLTGPEAGALVSELRSMALLSPGQDEKTLRRAKEICFLLRGLDPERRLVGERAERTYGQLEILLSTRRWKVEPASLEALRKEIKSACDRLRVAVEAAVHANGSV